MTGIEPVIWAHRPFMLWFNVNVLWYQQTKTHSIGRSGNAKLETTCLKARLKI